MTTRPSEWARGALYFSMFGLCMEIVFTGLWAGWDGSFRGEVSLLMIPMYELAYALLVTVVPWLESLYYLPAWVVFALLIVPVAEHVRGLAATTPLPADPRESAPAR